MNKKKLALEVLSSPHMKKIASMNLVDKKTLHKMIAEEVMKEDEINEAPADTIRGVLSKLLKAAADDEQKKQAILNDFFTILQNPSVEGYTKLMPRFANKTPEQQQVFFDAGKKYQVNKGKHKEIVQKIIQAQSEPDVEAASSALVDNVEQQTGIEADTPEGTPEGEENVDLKAAAMYEYAEFSEKVMQAKSKDEFEQAYLEAVAYLQDNPEKAAIVYPNFEKTMEQAINIRKYMDAYIQSKGTGLLDGESVLAAIPSLGMSDNNKSPRNVLLAFLNAELGLEPTATPWTQAATDEPGEEVPPQLAKFRESEFYTALESDELKAGFDYVFKYFIDNAVISESLKDTVLKLGIKPADMRKALMALKDENDPAFKAVVAFLKEEQNVNAFVEAMRQFGLGTDAQPEPEPEEQQAPELDDVADIPETEIQVLEKAYSEWVSGFMTAKFLKMQANIFTALWGPIKQFAGKDKEALEQMERAINPATASKEEEEEASAPLDEQEAPPQDEPQDAPQEEPQESQEEKEEFKRSILEGLIVLKRHSTLIEDVLKLYQSQVQGGKVGSSEAFKKYGDGNPRNVIYKFANLIVKDINSILATIAELSPEEQQIAEALLEVEGEKFSDKLRLVKAVNKFVVGETDVLLKILKKTEERGATSQVQEPPAEQEQETQDAEQESPEQETANESLLREMSQNEALAIKEQALKVHDEMIKIKRFFPSAQPFDSEYSFDSVTKQMVFIIKTIKDHIATMSRFKDDKQITKTSLASAKEGLLIIKKSLIELLGLSDEGKPAAASENDAGYTEEGQEAIEAGEAEEPKPLDVTEFEIEDDEEQMETSDMNIGLPANLKRFMTSSRFLLDAKVKAALDRFDPEQQKTLLKFAAYLIGYMAPAKNPKLNENKQVILTTFSKGLGYDYDEMVKFMTLLNRVDPENVKAVGDVLKAGRTKVLFLLTKVSERMSEFNVHGKYADSSRLAMLKDLNIVPRKFGSKTPFDGRVEKRTTEPVGDDYLRDRDKFNQRVKDTEDAARKTMRSKRAREQFPTDLKPQDDSSLYNTPLNPDLRVSMPKDKKKKRKPMTQDDFRQAYAQGDRLYREQLEEKLQKIVKSILNNRK